MPTAPSSFGYRAYTLIELLVVVAIIAILASLLLPTIGLVRIQAGAAGCLSNQRQIAMANLAYGTEQRQLAPPFNSHELGAEAWGMWFGYLFKTDDALRGNQAFICPAPGRRSQVLKQVTWDRVSSEDSTNSVRYHGSSYGVNSWAQELLWDGSRPWPEPMYTVRVSRCRTPAQMIWMGEVVGCDTEGNIRSEGGINAPVPVTAPMWYDSTPGTWHEPVNLPVYTAAIGPYTLPVGTPAGSEYYLPRFSHRGRMSVSFYDGHVAGVSLADIVGDGSKNNLWYGFGNH